MSIITAGSSPAYRRLFDHPALISRLCQLTERPCQLKEDEFCFVWAVPMLPYDYPSLEGQPRQLTSET